MTETEFVLLRPCLLDAIPHCSCKEPTVSPIAMLASILMLQLESVSLAQQIVLPAPVPQCVLHVPLEPLCRTTCV